MDEDIQQSAGALADIGELNFLEAGEDDSGGDAGAGFLEVFEVAVSADFAAGSAGGEFDLEVLESAGAEVTQDGTIITDVITATVDEATGFAVIDEIIGVLTPDGDQITEERVSVLDPDGTFTVLADEVVVASDAEQR